MISPGAAYAIAVSVMTVPFIPLLLRGWVAKKAWRAAVVAREAIERDLENHRELDIEDLAAVVFFDQVSRATFDSAFGMNVKRSPFSGYFVRALWHLVLALGGLKSVIGYKFRRRFLVSIIRLREDLSFFDLLDAADREDGVTK